MTKKIVLFFLIFVAFRVSAQELNCTVTINAEQIDQTNRQIFKTLERSLNDFVNKTEWTNRTFAPEERIECSMLITINSYQSDNFDATIQVQSSRPVFDTNYLSPVFNHNDKQFTFNYIEYEPLFYNPNSFESNLVGVITFYANIILGLDADTFSEEGGTTYFEKARAVVTLAQGSGYFGWQQIDGNRTRFILIDNLLSNTFKEYRSALYDWHRNGLDIMTENPAKGKDNMAGTLKLFEKLIQRRPNAYLLQTFFDAKSEEIRSMFKEGPGNLNKGRLIETLNKIAPFYGSTWREIQN